jgi:hypothetical protein
MKERMKSILWSQEEKLLVLPALSQLHKEVECENLKVFLTDTALLVHNFVIKYQNESIQ